MRKRLRRISARISPLVSALAAVFSLRDASGCESIEL